MVIGVVGTFAAGKDTVAEYLQQKGFDWYSTSDEIRDELRTLNKSLDRDTMVTFAGSQKAKYGNAYYAEKIIKRVHGDIIISAMREPEAIDYLRRLPDFYLITVDAPIERRFARAVERGRLGDGNSLEEFRIIEEREMSGKLSAQRLGKVIAMADYTIINDGTLAELHKKVDTVLEQILK